MPAITPSSLPKWKTSWSEAGSHCFSSNLATGQSGRRWNEATRLQSATSSRQELLHPKTVQHSLERGLQGGDIPLRRDEDQINVFPFRSGNHHQLVAFRQRRSILLDRRIAGQAH